RTTSPMSWSAGSASRDSRPRILTAQVSSSGASHSPHGANGAAPAPAHGTHTIAASASGAGCQQTYGGAVDVAVVIRTLRCFALRDGRAARRVALAAPLGADAST